MSRCIGKLSHLKILGGPKVARAALSRRAMDRRAMFGNVEVQRSYVYLLFGG